MSISVPPISPAPTGNADVPSEPIWRLTVAQYHEMIRMGILNEDDPVELLEGWLVTKMPKNPPHRLATRLARQALERIVPDGWFVDAQDPITTQTSEPEPDLLVVRGEPRQYADHHPGPGDLALVIEVADSSLSRDRTWKKRLYAQAGIPVYWIVNLLEPQVEVYSDPTGPADQPDYRLCQVFGVSDTLSLTIDGREVGRLAVQELLP